MPEGVDVIAGPGCPVCVTPAADIDSVIKLALEGVVITTFGDIFRVPGSNGSLMDAKAEGGDVRVVYSISDAVEMARKEPNKEFVFLAIGFETTAPSTAVEVLRGAPENLSFLISHRLIPPAMELMLGVGDVRFDGFIAPGHVSTIIGLKAYEVFPKAYGMPVVVAGFEPLDVLVGIYMVLRQVRERRPRLENEYKRAVTWDGNVRAQELMAKAFSVVDGFWRGLGKLPRSALDLREEFSKWDARRRYGLKPQRGRDLLPGCQCHLIIIGKIKPIECPLFLRACRPDSPKGPCMVSFEGTCRIWAKHALMESTTLSV